MDDLFYCIRVMQLSTDKLQLARNSECLRRSSLIRTTFLQSRKHFCDLVHSLIKLPSSASSGDALVPVLLQHNGDERTKLLPCQRAMPAQKRKSCHVDAVKRMRVTSASTASTNAPNHITSD